MSKKNIIQLVIIIAAFGAAGIVLYNGFFANKGPSSPATSVVAAVQSPQDILPYGGDNFDFSVLTKRPFVFNEISYQTVDAGTEVGILPPDSMISSPGVGQ